MWQGSILKQYLNAASFVSTLDIPKNTILLYEPQEYSRETCTMMFHKQGWIIASDRTIQQLFQHWFLETLYQPLTFQSAFKMYFKKRYKHLPLIGRGNLWLPLMGTVCKNAYCWINPFSIHQIRKTHYGSLCFLSYYEPFYIPMNPEAIHEKVRKALWMYREVVRLAEKLSVIHDELYFYQCWNKNNYIEKQYQYVLNHECYYPYLDLEQFYECYVKVQSKD